MGALESLRLEDNPLRTPQNSAAAAGAAAGAADAPSLAAQVRLPMKCTRGGEGGHIARWDMEQMSCVLRESVLAHAAVPDSVCRKSGEIRCGENGDVS